MATFRVVIEGATLPGFDLNRVRTSLAALIKKDEAFAGQLLAGTDTTIKSAVDQATGLRYVAALKNVGVASRIEVETSGLDFDTSAVGINPSARDKRLDEKFCADCGSAIKIKAELCPRCGVRQQTAPGPIQKVSVHQTLPEGFYKSSDDAMLGGVCAGLAKKWNVTRAGLRLITFIACIFLWIPLLIYIACWIIFPAYPTKGPGSSKSTKWVPQSSSVASQQAPSSPRRRFSPNWMLLGGALVVLIVVANVIDLYRSKEDVAAATAKQEAENAALMAKSKQLLNPTRESMIQMSDEAEAARKAAAIASAASKQASIEAAAAKERQALRPIEERLRRKHPTLTSLEIQAMAQICNIQRVNGC